MSPKELVMFTRTEFQAMVLRPQIDRDTFAQEVSRVGEEQCYAAVELGDEQSFLSYSRALRFINRFINRYLYGMSTESLD